MFQFRESLPTALASAFPAVFLCLGCSNAAPEEPAVSPPGIGGTLSAAAGGADGSMGGAHAASGSTTGTGDAGESAGGADGSSAPSETSDPAWFAGCDVGEIRGSCSAIDDSGDYCIEFPTTGLAGVLDIAGTCGPERVRPEPRCATENAVAVCVSQYSRNIFYDREAADSISRVGVCKHYCSDSGGVPAPKCEEFLTCLCGAAEPQDDDSAGCLEAREHVATIRRDFGPANANRQCTELLAMTPACAAE